MIGDRAEDMTGPRANGVHAIAAAVSWGYGTEAELTAAAPDMIVQSPKDLLAYLNAR
jgi:phosphoglycolate phosphatase-like HAD superfamily hydrolase